MPLNTKCPNTEYSSVVASCLHVTIMPWISIRGEESRTKRATVVKIPDVLLMLLLAHYTISAISSYFNK